MIRIGRNSIRGLTFAVFIGLISAASEAAPGSFTTVEELWRDFDPRALPLAAKTIKETVADGIVLRTVQYAVEETSGHTVRILAQYGFPEGTALPAVMHIHGGGQIANVEYVKLFAKRGYAVLSVNWGGRPLPGIDASVPAGWEPLPYNQNGADQGSVYRTTPDARANSWYHWTIACRRGITFLEQQPEVDRSRIGIFGVSMGGRLTWLVAGTDERVRCATSVYGATLMDEPIPGIEGSEQVPAIRGNSVWRTLLDAQAYAPRIKCPFLYLSAANDFFGRLDLVDRTLTLIPDGQSWRSLAQHFSHHVSQDVAPALTTWFDRWLQQGPEWPASPRVELALRTADHNVVANIAVDRASEIKSVDVYYSTGRFPQSRFWRTVAGAKAGPKWAAKLPTTELADLKVFANVTYASGLVLSTPLAVGREGELKAAGVGATDPPTLEFEDFSRGPVDWFVTEAGADPILSTRKYFREPAGPDASRGITWGEGRLGNWRFVTRKIGDPKWRPPAGAAFQIDVRAERPNSLTVFVVENYESQPWPTRVFSATSKLAGGGQWETVTFRGSDWREVYDGGSEVNWDKVNLLGVAGKHRFVGNHMRLADREIGVEWEGPPPTIGRMRWTTDKE